MKHSFYVLWVAVFAFASCSKSTDAPLTVLTPEEQKLVKVWRLTREHLITSGSNAQDTIYHQFLYGPSLTLSAELSPAAASPYLQTAHYPANAKTAVDKFSFWGGMEMRRGSNELSSYWRIDSTGALQTSEGRYYFKLMNQTLVLVPLGLRDTLWFE